ncbi:MAG: repeat-containing protein [Acidobacteria bacterium]|nr:repeat-containing protein [Acidobacteriota bacterium]
MKTLLSIFILILTFTAANYASTSQTACAYTFTPSETRLPVSGGTGTITITASDQNCTWSLYAFPSPYNLIPPWLTLSKTSGTGNAIITYTVPANTDAPRGAHIYAGMDYRFSIGQEGVCNYSIWAEQANFTSAGVARTWAYSSHTPGCSTTTPVSSADWLTIITVEGAAYSGLSYIYFSVAPNLGEARTATITVNGRVLTITQADGCNYSLSVSDIYLESSGGAAGVNFSANQGCSWTAQSNVPWITVNNSSGSGNGTINFSVAPNTGQTRVGSITVGGKTLAVSQSAAPACAVSLSSTSAGFAAGGAYGTFSVSGDCPFTATTDANWITIKNTSNGVVSYSITGNKGAQRTGVISVNGQSFTVTQDAGGNKSKFFDFDGDGKADFSIYRPEVGEWWFLKSSDGGNAAAQFGKGTDKPVPADYTGDGKTDFAFWRPASGEWFILRSEDYSYYAFPFGIEGDIPVPADYDGDGKADAAVYRPSEKVWYISKSTGGVSIQHYGENGDVPVPADYNGDGKTDLSVYNSSSGSWKVKYDFGGLELSVFRANSNKPLPADYTGDGKADIVLYDVVTNDWFIIRSENQTGYTVKFGANGDIPAPADYDGDGKTDLAIYRPSTSDWWYAASASNGAHRAAKFGVGTDVPLPSAYIR